MKILGQERILDFERTYPESTASLEAWYNHMDSNSFSNFVELRRIFGSADYIRPYTVFNIAGNKYRPIGVVNYVLGQVDIRDIMTHTEYDKGKWRQ